MATDDNLVRLPNGMTVHFIQPGARSAYERYFDQKLTGDELAVWEVSRFIEQSRTREEGERVEKHRKTVENRKWAVEQAAKTLGVCDPHNAATLLRSVAEQLLNYVVQA